MNIPTQFENEKLDFKNCKYILQCYYKYLGNMSKTSDCSICTNDNSKEKCVILRTCGHKFHQRCIDKWFESKDTCPNCRKKCDVTPSLIKMDVSIKKLKNIKDFKNLNSLTIKNRNENSLECNYCNNIIFENYGLVSNSDCKIIFCENCVVKKQNRCYEILKTLTYDYILPIFNNNINNGTFKIELSKITNLPYFKNSLPKDLHSLDLSGPLSFTITNLNNNKSDNNNFNNNDDNNDDNNFNNSDDKNKLNNSDDKNKLNNSDDKNNLNNSDNNNFNNSDNNNFNNSDNKFNNNFNNSDDNNNFNNNNNNNKIATNNSNKKNNNKSLNNVTNDYKNNTISTYKLWNLTINNDLYLNNCQSASLVNCIIKGDIFVNNCENFRVQNCKFTNPNTLVKIFQNISNYSSVFLNDNTVTVGIILDKTNEYYKNIFKNLTDIEAKNLENNFMKMDKIIITFPKKSLNYANFQLKIKKHETIVLRNILFKTFPILNSKFLTTIMLDKITLLPVELLDLTDNKLLVSLVVKNIKIKNIILPTSDNLEDLKISNTNITTINYLSKNIEEILLQNNKISHIPPIKDLNNITLLNLHCNKLDGEFNIENCNILDTINISNNNITQITISSSNNKITNLHANNNKLTNFEITLNHSMERITLENNNLSSFNCKFCSFSTVPHHIINTLHLSNNKLTNISLDKEFRVNGLYCSHNKLKSIENIYVKDFLVVRNNKNLETLNIQCDELMQTIDIRHNNLKNIYFSHSMLEVCNFKKCDAFTGKFVELLSDEFFRKFIIFKFNITVHLR